MTTWFDPQRLIETLEGAIRRVYEQIKADEDKAHEASQAIAEGGAWTTNPTPDGPTQGLQC